MTREKFILGGRLIFGPDASSLIITMALIIVPVIIFCIFVAWHLRHKFNPSMCWCFFSCGSRPWYYPTYVIHAHRKNLL
ncbi:hypothetical protein MLD38_022655 [Melastoma candidum]|uniref:Uncharacterized protein n=1 Tax=Melastoma candidum TaxID=119954 RepID=A0ACB9QJB8_9MYRT|nr:hypothetical protein MLD38_022655 [Melastoma candidum]